MKKATVLLLKQLFHRHQKERDLLKCLRYGLKALLTITFLASIGYFSELHLLIAPFGASCILIFTSPEDNFSQPINIIGGYTVAILVSAVMIYLLPYAWWSLGLMLALTISAMAYLRVTHPPCGAIPLLVGSNQGIINEDIFVTILGSILLVAITIILHRIPPRMAYPKPLPKKS